MNQVSGKTGGMLMLVYGKMKRRALGLAEIMSRVAHFVLILLGRLL